jgi:hypothetical protein
MIPALIFVISVAAFLQFFVSYCRSVIAAYGEVELSEQARQVTGIHNRQVKGNDFKRLLQLVRLCPAFGEDEKELRAVRIYYALLNGVQGLLRPIYAAAAEWMELERQGCAYFVAVALDRRIARNRVLLEQQNGG